MAEFSDVPLALPTGEETYHDIFKAKHVTSYLEEYIDSHMYSGKSLRDRIVFGFTVSTIEKTNDIWKIHRKVNAGRPDGCCRTRKLMIATGMTSQPNMPEFSKKDEYKGRIFHQKDFGRSSVLSNAGFHQIAILGAGKSAADMVYAAAKADKKVSWIIRESGSGPAAFIDIKGRGAYRNAAEIGHTRLMTVMGPSCFVPPSVLSRFVHESEIGRMIGRKVWKNADRDLLEEANYHGRPGAMKGFEQLKPSAAYVSSLFSSPAKFS